MTGRDLEKYLVSLGVFTTQNNYIVDIVDGKVDGMIPSFYKMYIPVGSQYEIKISYGNDKGTRLVNFKLDKINLSNTYRLDQLDFPTLKEELSKIFKIKTNNIFASPKSILRMPVSVQQQDNFIEWSRHWSINEVLS